MSLTLVLAAWALVLLIPAVVRIRNRGIVTSVSRFHNSLIVLGRTSTTHHGSGHVNTTETYVWARASTARTQYAAAAPTVSPGEMRRNREVEIRQRRTMVLFSLFVLVLVSALVTLLAVSLFTLGMLVVSVGALAMYIAMLIRINNMRSIHAMQARYAGAEVVETYAAPRGGSGYALGAAKSAPIRIAPTFEAARAR